MATVLDLPEGKEAYVSGVILHVRCDGCGRQLGTGWYRRVMMVPTRGIVLALYHGDCREKAERMLRWRCEHNHAAPSVEDV